MYVINIAETYGKVDIYLNQFINIILVWNSGIGFGLLSSQDSNIYNLITIIIVLINILIIFFIYKYDDIRSFFIFNLREDLLETYLIEYIFPQFQILLI